ncbi:MAG: TIGR04086 family membrane protein [bacterium]|jgi:putative membrane protein (TIGR04086 family)
MNLGVIIIGGVITFVFLFLSSLALVFLGPALPEAALLAAAFLMAVLSILLGSAYAASRAGQRHVLHGILAAMVCLNLTFPFIIIYGSQMMEISPGVAIAGIMNYSLFGAVGGIAAKHLGRRR